MNFYFLTLFSFVFGFYHPDSIMPHNYEEEFDQKDETSNAWETAAYFFSFLNPFSERSIRYI